MIYFWKEFKFLFNKLNFNLLSRSNNFICIDLKFKLLKYTVSMFLDQILMKCLTINEVKVDAFVWSKKNNKKKTLRVFLKDAGFV